MEIRFFSISPLLGLIRLFKSYHHLQVYTKFQVPTQAFTNYSHQS